MFLWKTVLAGLLTVFSQIRHVTSHGSLIQPAQRSGAWRFGFQNPINYNDNQLFCGGKGVQWNAENNGKCGVCGDPANAGVKPNEDVNGTFVQNGVITGSYVKGSVMLTKVNLTAYHKGWFEFRLCPLETFTTKVTQACLNRTVLAVAGTSTTRIDLENIKIGSGTAVYTFYLQLPQNITCDRCVLQWRYNTGNSWGCEPAGCCIGCGKQENFVNCADIAIADGGSETTSSVISSSTASQSATMTALTSSTTSQTSTHSQTSQTPTSTSSQSSTTPSTTTTTTTTTVSTTTQNSSTSGTQSATTTTTTASGNTNVQCSSTLTCSVTQTYITVPGLGTWCCQNCPRGFCPSTHCLCN